MRRPYAAILAAALVCVFATAACDRRGRIPESGPPPAPVVTTTDRPAPAPEEPAAAAEQATTDLASVDQVLNEIESDLSSVEAAPPDAD